MPYEFFPHTGDIGLRLWGASIEELMRSAALAFTDAVVDPASVRALDARHVTCRATAPDLLLHDFLAELLYQFDAHGRLVRDADVAVVRDGEEWTLDATTRGEPVDAARHAIRLLVKGVTYHALSAIETPEGWQGTVILDI
jgi:SHS2 domain-containing protein